MIKHGLHGKSGIYEIVNLINGKRYIGSGVNLGARMDAHFSNLRCGRHHNKHMQAAYNLYGESTFEFRAAKFCQPEELLTEEQREIDNSDRSQLYNHRRRATSNLGMQHSEQTRAKMSAAHRGMGWSPQMREKMAKRQWSAESRAKIAKSKTGQKLSPETLAKIHANPEKRLARVVKPYPSFTAPDGTVYPPGVNLLAFCRQHGLKHEGMRCVIQRKYSQHHGWTLTKNSEE